MGGAVMAGYAPYERLIAGSNITIEGATISSSGSITDHGNLAGLSDDDHAQYSLVDGTRAFTGAVTVADKITFTDVTTNGVLDWHGGVGEDYFEFDDDLLIDGSEKLFFNALTAHYITGNLSTNLRLNFDTQWEIYADDSLAFTITDTKIVWDLAADVAIEISSGEFAIDVNDGVGDRAFYVQSDTLQLGAGVSNSNFTINMTDDTPSSGEIVYNDGRHTFNTRIHTTGHDGTSSLSATVTLDLTSGQQNIFAAAATIGTAGTGNCFGFQQTIVGTATGTSTGDVYGNSCNHTIVGTGTWDNIYGYASSMTLSASGGFGDIYGFWVQPVSISSADLFAGLYVFDPTVTTSLTNCYGIYVREITSGNVTNPYELFLETAGRAYFRDADLYVHSQADGTLDLSADTEINFRNSGTVQALINDGTFQPETDNDIDLGTSSKYFKDLYLKGRMYWADYHSETTTVDSTASDAEFNVFDEDNYSAFASTENASRGVTFTSTDGRFTVSRAGVYRLGCNFILNISSSALCLIICKINGSTVYSHQINIHSSVDPVTRVIDIIDTLAASDYVEFYVDSATAGTVSALDGTTANIHMIS